jgi:hypothetical protein
VNPRVRCRRPGRHPTSLVTSTSGTLFAAVIPCGCGGSRDAKRDQVPRKTLEPNEDQAKAVAKIQKLGGKVTVDEKSPDKPVIGVDLRHTKITDADLAHLKALTKLHNLALSRTWITDAGLEHLKGLTNVSLFLLNTKVTPKGAKKIQQAIPNSKGYHWNRK